MNGELERIDRPFFKRLLSPLGITAIILVIFAVGEGYLAWRDRGVEATLESSPAFTTPAFDLTFSKKLPYDPLSFLGKGADAGFWKWSPDGLVLTDMGRQYFDEQGDIFVSRAPAGKRQIKRIRVNEGTDNGERRIEFVYEWTEVSPVAAALIAQPPRQKESYDGQALMTRDGKGWKVKSLRTDDFDLPMAHLKEVASGVLK